jgi:ribonuclease Z
MDQRELGLRKFELKMVRNYLKSQILTKDSIGILKFVKIYELSRNPSFSDIKMDSSGVFSLVKDEKYTVRAKFIHHSIECFGYVIEESDKRGKVDIEKVNELKIPIGPILKELTSGKKITLEDGRTVSPSDIMGKSFKGRKVVILGDTVDPANIISIGKHCDYLIHESTFSKEHTQMALDYKHSTSTMAGRFAKIINTKNLILTHFSSRYTNSDLEQIKQEAIK